MKTFFSLLGMLLISLLPFPAFSADTKVSDLTAITSPSDSALLLVTDPSASPQSRKYLLTNLVTQTALNGKVNSSAALMTFSQTDITYSATTDLDMSAANIQTLALTGDVTFTTSNRATGRWKTIIISSDGSTRTLAFPVGWDFASGTAPSSIAANKIGLLSVMFRDSTDANAVATYTVQDAITGDVAGPASSTDNAIARFDLTTGKLIQNSGATVDDSGNVNTGSGSATVPSVAWSADADGTGTGLYRSVANRVSVAINGLLTADFVSDHILLQNAAAKIIFADATLRRDNTATLQMGDDLSTPVAQVFKGSDGSGTDRPGGRLTLQGGNGTGTNAAGAVVIRTSNSGDAGSTQGTPSERFHAIPKWVTLTDNTATSLFTVPVAATNFIGLTATVTVYVRDGTDFQSLTTPITVDAVAKTTTITAVVAPTGAQTALAGSAGTLSVTYTVTDNGSNVMAVKCTADTSLTPTIMRAFIVVTAINSNGTAVLTEL